MKSIDPIIHVADGKKAGFIKMKRNVYSSILLAFAVVLTLNSCSSEKSDKPFSAQGTVQRIEPGKDGYTAYVKGEDGKEFDAVISRVKMEQAYKTLKEGDQVELFGDTIHLDNKVRVLVTRIEP